MGEVYQNILEITLIKFFGFVSFCKKYCKTKNILRKNHIGILFLKINIQKYAIQRIIGYILKKITTKEKI